MKVGIFKTKIVNVPVLNPKPNPERQERGFSTTLATLADSSRVMPCLPPGGTRIGQGRGRETAKERESERARERESERERGRERECETARERESERQRVREGERERGREGERERARERESERERERESERARGREREQQKRLLWERGGRAKSGRSQPHREVAD